MDDVLAKVDVPRRRWTAEEYHQMGEAGILGPDDRVELIEGEIIHKPVIGPRHVVCVAELSRRLLLAVGDRAVVWPQGPIRLRRVTEPEPDLTLLRPRGDRYLQAPAHAEDTLLVVEVADSSYRYDLGVKLPLYALAGIPELWIVDLTHDIVEVHRQPARSGHAFRQRVGLGGTVSPADLPDIALAVDHVLLAR
jgi:Uma2 family endonuclease